MFLLFPERHAPRAACLQAGIPPQHILAGRGPFSVEQNRRHIRAFGIGVLVTKDSGRAGGVPEKLQAARSEHCRVVALRRPEAAGPAAFTDVGRLLRAVQKAVPDYRRGAP